MGLYDRDYYQGEDDRAGQPLFANRPVYVILIVINVAVFFANFLFSSKDFSLVSTLQIDGAALTKPWLWWKFLTYGFAHNPDGIQHVLFNMVGLYFFGRSVESKLGRAEFLRFYLVAIVVGGITFAVRAHLMGVPNPCIGASGATVAVTLLFIFWYPHQELLLMFVLPVKAWVVGVLIIVSNFFGFVGANVANDVHIAGIVFAGIYYHQRWNLAFLSPAWLTSFAKKRPKLKIHDPGGPSKHEQKDSREADRILQKIHEKGEESLTNAERKTLERHSRRLRERK